MSLVMRNIEYWIYHNKIYVFICVCVCDFVLHSLPISLSSSFSVCLWILYFLTKVCCRCAFTVLLKWVCIQSRCNNVHQCFNSMAAYVFLIFVLLIVYNVMFVCYSPINYVVVRYVFKQQYIIVIDASKRYYFLSSLLLVVAVSVAFNVVAHFFFLFT